MSKAGENIIHGLKEAVNFVREINVVDGVAFGRGARKDDRQTSPYCDQCSGETVVVWRVEPEYRDSLVVLGVTTVIHDHTKVARCLGCRRDILWMMPAEIEYLTAKVGALASGADRPIHAWFNVSERLWSVQLQRSDDAESQARATEE